MLTERQREVAVLVRQGANYEAIARALHMSPHTVRSHVRSIAATLPNEHGLPALRLVRQWALRTITLAVSSGGDARRRQA